MPLNWEAPMASTSILSFSAQGVWLLYGGECCWGAAASAAVVDLLHGCGGVDGLVRSRVWAEALHLCQS